MRLASVALFALIGLLTSAPRFGFSRAPAASAAEPALVAHAQQAMRHFVVADSGNEVRYLVREQLARIDFPSDAVGKTHEISGGIVIGADGKPVPNESKFIFTLLPKR